MKQFKFKVGNDYRRQDGKIVKILKEQFSHENKSNSVYVFGNDCGARGWRVNTPGKLFGWRSGAKLGTDEFALSLIPAELVGQMELALEVYDAAR